MMERLVIRPVQLAEIDQIVDIHLKSFSGFFLSFLGCKFLRLLYRGIYDEAGGIILVAEYDNRIVGFVGGVKYQPGFYKRLIRQQLLAFAWASLGAFLYRPSIAPRLFRALRRSSAVELTSITACLMSIAVLPEYEGLKIGRALVDKFNRAMYAQKVTCYYLTTDRDHNERANRFYQSLGFQLRRSYVTPEGRSMNEYIMSLE